MRISLFLLSLAFLLVDFSYSYPAYLKGPIVPMVTPYTGGQAQEVDEKALAEFVDYLCQTKVAALFPVSGMGQWRHLSEEEKKQVIKVTADVSNGRKPILAGIGSTKDIKETIRVARFAEKQGVDALVVVTPYHLRKGNRIKDQSILLGYFNQLLPKLRKPIFLYDPKAEIDPQTFSQLIQSYPLIIGIKYREKKDMNRFAEMVKAGQGRVGVVSGTEKLTIKTMRVGGVGVIGSGVNLYPNLLAELVRLCETKNWDHAEKLQEQITHANTLVENLGGGAQGIKKILNDILGVRMSVENRSDTFRKESYPGEHKEILDFYKSLHLTPYTPSDAFILKMKK